jgi:hypothetical protein
MIICSGCKHDFLFEIDPFFFFWGDLNPFEGLVVDFSEEAKVIIQNSHGIL